MKHPIMKRTTGHGAGTWVRCAASALCAIVALAGAGAESAHAADLQYHGLLDLVISQRGPAFDGNIFTRGDSPFDPAGVRLFAESKVNDRAQVFAQIPADAVLRGFGPPPEAPFGGAGGYPQLVASNGQTARPEHARGARLGRVPSVLWNRLVVERLDLFRRSGRNEHDFDVRAVE